MLHHEEEERSVIRGGERKQPSPDATLGKKKKMSGCSVLCCHLRGLDNVISLLLFSLTRFFLVSIKPSLRCAVTKEWQSRSLVINLSWLNEGAGKAT